MKAELLFCESNGESPQSTKSLQFPCDAIRYASDRHSARLNMADLQISPSVVPVFVIGDKRFFPCYQ